MARNTLQVTINGKEFVSKEAKKAETSLTGLQKVGNLVNKALVASFAAAAAGVAASVAAMGKAVSSTEKLADNIDKMSQKIGISRDAFQEWDFILSQNGMNIDQLRTSMKTLAGAAEEASRGTITYTRTFDALGISIYDTSGALKDQEDLLFDSISALSEMENTTLRTAYASDLFGRSATELSPLLNSGADSVENLRQKAHDLGLVLSDETVDAGVKLHDTMDQLRRTFQAVVAKAVTPLMSEINDLGQMFLKQIQDGGGLQRFISVFVKGFSWIANNIQKIGAIVRFSFEVIAAYADFAARKVTELADSIGLIDIAQGTINFIVEIGGNVYDAIKEGLETGDWSSLFGATAKALNTGILISVGLYLLKAFGLVVGSGFSAMAAAIASKIGIVTSGVALGGAAATIGLVSVAVALTEAVGTGDWKTFGENMSAAITGGLLAAGLTLSPSSVWTIPIIILALGGGKFLENWTEENLTDELAKEIADGIKAWWNDDVIEPLNDIWDFGEIIWNGVIAGIKKFFKTIDIVGAIVDLINEDIESFKAEDQSAAENSFGLEYADHLWTGIKAGIKSFFKTIDFVGALVDLMRDALNKDKTDITEVGEETGGNLIDGLVIGMEDKKGFFSGVVDTFVSLWRKAWLEKSPSRVAIKTGENIILGLIKGIEDPVLKDRLELAFQNLVAAFQEEVVVDPSAVLGNIFDGDATPQASGGYSLQRFGDMEPKVWDPSGGGESDLLAALSDVTGSLNDLDAILDPIGTIFAGMMEVLQPAIDSILKPIVNILKILGATIGQILLPVFEAVGVVVEKLGEAFVWLYNKVIKPVGNFLIEGFNSIANGILRAVNGIINAINWAFGWLGVKISKVALRDADQGKLADISMSQVMAGTSSSAYSGSAPGSSTSVQQLNINVYQYFQGNVIGDGGMESVGEFTINALKAYAGAGGNVQVVSA